MQQDPLYGYFAAVAGPVSNDIIKIIRTWLFLTLYAVVQNEIKV